MCQTIRKKVFGCSIYLRLYNDTLHDVPANTFFEEVLLDIYLELYRYIVRCVKRYERKSPGEVLLDIYLKLYRGI